MPLAQHITALDGILSCTRQRLLKHICILPATAVMHAQVCGACWLAVFVNPNSPHGMAVQTIL